MVIPPNQTQAIETPISISHPWNTENRTRGKGAWLKRGCLPIVLEPSSHATCVLLSYDQFRTIVDHQEDTSQHETEKWANNFLNWKNSFRKTSMLFMKRIALPCNFTPRKLEKSDVHVLALEPHSYGISIAYSHFLQNRVCNLKHVSSYVFPIYQLFN